MTAVHLLLHCCQPAQAFIPSDFNSNSIGALVRRSNSDVTAKSNQIAINRVTLFSHNHSRSNNNSNNPYRHRTKCKTPSRDQDYDHDHYGGGGGGGVVGAGAGAGAGGKLRAKSVPSNKQKRINYFSSSINLRRPVQIIGECYNYNNKSSSQNTNNNRKNEYQNVVSNDIDDDDYDSNFHTYSRVSSYSNRYKTQLRMVSSGLTFDDGDQLLVSAQKPLGMVLEEREDDDDNDGLRSQGGCIVASVIEGGAACRAGVKEGDLLVAVQNADVESADFEEVMSRIQNAPKVVNLRFWRKER